MRIQGPSILSGLCFSVFFLAGILSFLCCYMFDSPHYRFFNFCQG